MKTRFFAVLLAVMMIVAVCVAATAEQAVMTHAQFDAAQPDDPVTVETWVQAHEAYYKQNGTVCIHAQSPDGAYYVFDAKVPEETVEKLKPGVKIRVSGFKSVWEGEVEITDAKVEIIEGEPFIAEPLDVTEMLGKDELEKHMNEFVSFKGMKVEASNDSGAAFLYKADGSGSREANSDVYFKVSKNGQTYQFSVRAYLCDNTTDVYKAAENLKVGDTVDMEGFLYWYNGANPHITSIKPAAA